MNKPVKNQKLRNIINKKVMPAIRTPKGEFVDCVRVRIASEQEDYLREAAIGKRMQADREYQMLQMDEQRLKECKLTAENGKLLYVTNKMIASTKDKVSKGKVDKQKNIYLMEKGLQAFVMDKDGALYIATHKGDINEDPSLNMSHASFLSSKPAELAGMISINDEGKIIKINDHSGHYRPEPLDVYRGIKKLEKQNVLDQNCLVVIGRKSKPISAFIKDMEAIQPSGKMLHEELREARIDRIYNRIADISSINHQIDYFVSSLNSNSDSTKLTDLFERVVESQDHKSMEHFVANLRKTGKLQDFINSSESPMHFVASYGTPEMARVLLDNGASLESKDKDEQTALHKAVSYNSLKMTKFLIDNGADSNAKDYEGATAFHKAVSDDYLEKAKALLDTNRDLLNIRDNDLDSPIHYATSNGSLQMAKFLFEKGASVNDKDNKEKSLLHKAVSRGKEDIAEFLLNNGADLNAKDQEGKTPIHNIALSRNVELLKFLIDKGADLTIEDNAGYTPEAYMKLYAPEMLEVLQQESSDKSKIKLDQESKRTENRTRFPVSIEEVMPFIEQEKLKKIENPPIDIEDELLSEEQEKAVKEVFSLIEHKGSNKKYNDKIFKKLEGFSKEQLDMPCKNNNTLLHMASYYGNTKLCDHLIREGSDVSIKNGDGNRPIDLADKRPKRTWMEYFKNFFREIQYPSSEDLKEVVAKLRKQEGAQEQDKKRAIAFKGRGSANIADRIISRGNIRSTDRTH
jgi:ankyrin repeat protein